MKKLKLFFALFAMLALGVGNAWAEDVTETITMKGFAGITSSGYQNVTKTGASDKGTAMVAYAYNGSTGQVRGNKTKTPAGASVTSADDTRNWSLYNSEAMAGAIKAIKVTQTATGTNKFQNNLYVSLGTSSQGSITAITNAQKQDAGGTAQEINFTIDASKGYTYFKLLSTEKFVTGTIAGVVVTVTYETAGSGSTEPAPSLTTDQFSWSAATATATLPNTFDNKPTLTNIENLEVTYSSSNGEVATIDENGDVKLVGVGTADIKATAGDDITFKKTTVYYTLTVNKAPATPTDNVYVKVTTTAGITDGEYLIVYEAGNVAFDGSLTNLDAAGNMIEAQISSNTIAGNTEIDAATFTIASMTGGHSILSKSGKYIGRTSGSNGMNTGSSAIANVITFSNGAVKVAGSGSGASASLQYFAQSGSERFRYYTSTQKAIALYKKASKHTVTIADCTNGSVSAKMGETALATNDQVLSGIQITLSNEAATGYKLAAYDVYKTGDNTTKVTVTDGKFIMPEFDVTISATFELAKTLTGIEITTPATQTTFWKGETFNHEGLKVTAHFDGADDEDVTDKVTVTGSTATAGAAVEVTVSFTEGTTTKTTEYDITVKATANTKETAYDVITAREIIDKVSTADNVYVTGIVSEIVTPYDSEYGNITYNISADGLTTSNQLQAFCGKSYNGENFTSNDDIQVGDEVVVFGNLLKYSSTYELNAGNQLVDLKRDKQQAGLAYAVTELTAEVGATDFAEPELTNPNGLSVEYSTSDATLATVNATTGEVTIGNKAGTVTITASFAGNEDYVAGEASYTINITDPSVSSVTFDAAVDIPTEGLTLTKNGVSMTFTGGAMDNGENYRCYSGQKMTISYADGNITEIVIECTTNNDAKYGPGCFETETASYSYSGKVGTWTGEAKSITFNAKDQVRMTTVTVYYKQDTRTPAGIAWTPATVSLTVGDAFTAPTFSNPNGLTVSFESSNTALATVNNSGVISLVSGKTGTATITATYAGNEIYKPAEVTCVITVSPKSEKVVILAQYNGQWYALKAAYFPTYTNRLAAIPVNYVGGKLYNVAEADKATIEWQLAMNGAKATFKNGDNYLTGTDGTDLTLSTTTFEWDYDGELYLSDGGTRTFIYHKEGYFRNYATSNAIPNSTTYSYKPVVASPVYANGDIVYTREGLTNGKFGTICLPYGSSKYTGATFFEIAYQESGKVYIDEVTALEAGVPYIFQANCSTLTVTCEGTPDVAKSKNGLYGTFIEIADVAAHTSNKGYILTNNLIRFCEANCNVPANRAYIVLDDISTEKTPAPINRRRVGMSVQGENETTGLDNITNGENTTIKVIENGQLIIIREGVKYNVQGQKL